LNSQQDLFSIAEPSHPLVAGVDEVGRGPLIGDVVAAAVILPKGFNLPIRDSKKLSKSKREAYALQIKAEAISYAIYHVTPEEIDEVNILQATMNAMKGAIEALSHTPDKVLVDGNRCPKVQCLCEAIVKGDDKVAEISAASILAKVARDQQMLELDALYPQYGFAQHKGYPTKAHLQALEKYGLIEGEGYRRSFKPVQRILQK